jgi:hypothetical protein
MTTATQAEAGLIGTYRTGDLSKLPGGPVDQRRVHGDFRLALESVISLVLSDYGKKYVIEGPRPQENTGQECAVFAEPPFESAEDASQAAKRINECWQAKLDRLGPRISNLPPASLDSFVLLSPDGS